MVLNTIFLTQVVQKSAENKRNKEDSKTEKNSTGESIEGEIIRRKSDIIGEH